MFKNFRSLSWLRNLTAKYKINYFVLYFAVTLLSCLLINYSIVFPLLDFIGLFVYSLFKWKEKILIFLIVSVLYLSFLINWLLLNINETALINNQTYRITSIKSSYLVVVRNLHKHYLSIYDVDQSQLVLNRYLRISGELANLDGLSPNNNYEFNFASYLNKTGVKYQLKVSEVTYLNHGLLYQLNCFYNKLFNHELTKIFIMNNRVNSEVIKEANSLSLSYLFNFGGLPIFLMSYLLQKGLKLVKLNVKAISISLIVIDCLFLLFCLTINFPFLLTKTCLFLLIKNIFKLKRIAINKVKLWIICFTLLIAIHNEVFLNKTFYYYLVAIIFLKQPKTKVLYKQIIYNLVLCSLTFMVVNMMVDYRFYYFNELFDFFLIPVFSLEAMFIYLTWWIPHMNVVYDFLLKLNLIELKFIHQFNYFYSCGFIPTYLYWIYFIGLYCLIANLYNKKINWLFALVVVISLALMFSYKFIDQSINQQFILLDVGNGQTLIYHSKNETILFDAGTGKGYSDNKIVSWFKYYGIDKVDKLFISHYHTDHYSGFEKLISNDINVSEAIKRDNPKEFIKTKDLIIDIFKNELIDKNENNNSLVYLIKFDHKQLLIMSDLEIKGEEQLLKNSRFINQVNNQVIDYMVIGHHGSKTSSSEELLELVKPKEVFISGHDDSNRHFPDLETINKLEKLHIPYKTTQENNDIWFQMQFIF